MHAKNSGSRLFLCILFAEFWDMVNFFGIVSILMLYTTNAFLFSDQESYIIYGAYLALFCGLPVVGGLLTDKFLGAFYSIVLGALFIALGGLSMFFQTKQFFFLGLAAIVTGVSMYKTACTNTVGKIYLDSDQSKGKAYTLFYVILNCGAVVGPILYGVVTECYGVRYCFLLSAVSILLSLALVALFRADFKKIDHDRCNDNKTALLKGGLLALVVFGIAVLCFFQYKLFDNCAAILFVVIIVQYVYIPFMF